MRLEALALQFGHGCEAVEMAPTKRPSFSGVLLQFGHGCEAVEIQASTPATVRVGLLQFGHGCEAVEMWMQFSPAPWWRCFNSATAVKPWRFSAEAEYPIST